MKKAFKVILISFLIIFILPIVLIKSYYFYLGINHYVILGSLGAQKIANIAIEKKDSAICSKIVKDFDIGPGPTEQELKDNCFIQTATALKDIRICENVSNFYRKSCYLSIAYATNDEKLCEMGDDFFKSQCYGRISASEKDFRICEQAANQSTKDQCYVFANQPIGDISICDNKIINSVSKGDCYYGIVIFNTHDGASRLTEKDRLICEKITPGDTKNECLRYYNGNIK